MRLSNNLLIIIFLALLVIPIACGEEVSTKDNGDLVEDDNNDNGDDDDDDEFTDNDYGTGGTVDEDSFQAAQDSYSQVLMAYVHPDSGLVDYQGLLQNREGLDGFVEAIGGVEYDDYRGTENLPVEERLAFWINAYNAFTLQLILDNYPIKSIMLLGNPWDKFTFNVGGQGFTLNDIEHVILRTEFDEPRIHFAVNCASISCPKLKSEAYEKDTLEQDLEQATVDFIRNDQLHVKIDPDDGTVKFNVLLRWYKEDFGGLGGVADFVAQRISDQQEKEFLTSFDPKDIQFIPYNWGLNDI